jgi:xanthine dehydrogenase large subunit
MKHIDSIAHTRGESQYVDDMPQPAGLLHAAVFSSPVAHGIIKNLDIGKAKTMEGVIAVLTAVDIPGENQIGPIIEDELLLAEDTVYFVGQPVAVVVAVNSHIARKAVRKIKIDFRKLPVIVDPKEAYLKGEIIGTPRTFQLGDIDSAWNKCDLIVEGSCDIGGQEHVYLETQRARAIPQEGDLIKIYSSTQSPSAVQRHAAKILGLSSNKVEVDVKRIGGGFGGKEDQATMWSCLAALSAWHTQKPIELVLNRGEDVKMTGKRHPYKSDFKIGLKKDGKIVAYEVSHYQNSGAAADLSTAVLERTLFHSTNSYFIPNTRIFAVCCRTNLPPNTAFRGFGGPQGMFVIESAITEAAEVMGIRREKIQKRNLIKENRMFPYGQRAKNCQAGATWDKAVKIYEVKKIERDIAEFNQNHFEIKKGFALMPICFGISFTATQLNQASALVHIYTDGSVSVTTGGIEMGQGLSTNIAAIAEKALGINPDRIKIETTNTTRIANVSPSAASATTHLNGHATIVAIEQILDRLRRFIARELDLKDSRKIRISSERLYYRKKNTGWSWNKLIQQAYMNRIDLSAHGFFATPRIHFDREKEKGKPFAYHVYGTAVVEVTVDCLRGIYDIDSVKIVHDLGRPLNKLIDLGQIEGGLAQGLGWMTVEDLQFNEKGEYLSNSLATYKVPDVYFMPDNLQVHFLEKNEKSGPFGNKAVGEPPLMYGIGVFFAIRQAMRAFRPDFDFDFKSPLTPERVLMQLYSGRPDKKRATQKEAEVEVTGIPSDKIE